MIDNIKFTCVNVSKQSLIIKSCLRQKVVDEEGHTDNPIAYRGGEGLPHAIRLAAGTLEPFHLESPKFLTSLLCLLDTL